MPIYCFAVEGRPISYMNCQSLINKSNQILHNQRAGFSCPLPIYNRMYRNSSNENEKIFKSHLGEKDIYNPFNGDIELRESLTGKTMGIFLTTNTNDKVMFNRSRSFINAMLLACGLNKIEINNMLNNPDISGYGNSKKYTYYLWSEEFQCGYMIMTGYINNGLQMKTMLIAMTR